MKKKINQISAIRNNTGSGSDLYTRYKKQMELILASNDVRPLSDEDRAFYVEDELLEKELQALYEDETDTMSVLLGYAGIGKSTVLRNFFNFSNSTAVISEDEEALIFPAVFNGLVMDEENGKMDGEEKQRIAEKIRDDLTRRIDSVCSFLEKKYKELRPGKEFNKEDEKEAREAAEKYWMEIYDYLERTNPKVLEHVPYYERINLTDIEEKYLKFQYACKCDSFIVAVTRLKMYLGSEKCPCKKLIVILDDIEPLPYSWQVQLVLQYSRLYDCLKNVSTDSRYKKYLVNMLISMRPHTYGMIKGNSAVQSFSVTREIFKNNMVDVGTLFHKKIMHYSQTVDVSNKEAWEHAKRILHILTRKFNSKYSEMVGNLCLLNTRDAMKEYATVLSNRIWIQKNMDKESGFTINEDDYIFNNITVIRALACEQYYLYAKRGTYLIPNILCNTPYDENYSFLNLLIFKCFINEQDSVDVYGKQDKSYGEIVTYFLEAFPGQKKLKEHLEEMIGYLFQEKILCRSINDMESPENLNNRSDLKKDTLLYLSPKGYEIWKMIAADSVYLELCREDYYRDYDDEKLKLNKESSFELMQKSQQVQIFQDVFQLLLELLEEEDRYVSYAKTQHTLDIYVKYFGNDVICEHLLEGLWNSISYSGNSGADNLPGKRREVLEKINAVKRKLQ